MVFLKTLLILILLYYLLRMLGRWVAPWLFSYAVKKTEKRFREQFQGYQNEVADDGKVGEVSIDKNASNQKKSQNNIGEYIDFEEIE